jgi:hypothetical protein
MHVHAHGRSVERGIQSRRDLTARPCEQLPVWSRVRIHGQPVEDRPAAARFGPLAQPERTAPTLDEHHIGQLPLSERADAGLCQDACALPPSSTTLGNGARRRSGEPP